jgi:signal transduction histidine kinase
MTHHNSSKVIKLMSVEETNRIIRLVKDAIKDNRSKREIIVKFQDAGIIDKQGNLKSPYKEIYIPVEK